MVKVSVIVPVYNTHKYIRKCLDSLVEQTLKEIEIICVDDGSTDDSVSIIGEYTEKDDRVKLITQSNSHAGVARNNGIKNAVGEYLVFLDSDDFFEKDMLREMYEKCLEDKADVCLCSAKIYDEANGHTEVLAHYLNLEMLPKTTPFTPSDIAKNIFTAVSPAPWNKMFRREYIIENNLKFQPLKKANDLYFVYSAIACASSLTYVKKAFINYRTGNEQSLQGATAKLSYDFYTALSGLKQELVSRGLYKKFKISFANRALSTCFYALDRNSLKENFIATAEKLRQSWFKELDILGQPRSAFYNKSNYDRLIKFMVTPSEDLWLERDGSVGGNTNSKINIDLWISPIKIVYDNSIKISVIIPVYNVEKYLEECIDSVLNNTFTDFELICVDDGSTDRSPEILRSYAEKDKRVKVITKENGGQSSARNLGLKYAKGEYILFVDSDDYIEPRTMEFLYAEAKSDGLDQLFFGAKAFFDGEGDPNDPLLTYYDRKTEYNGVMTGKKMFCIMSEFYDFKPSPVLQLIRKDFLKDNNISFIEGIIYEDNPFTIQCLFYSQRVRFTNIDLYNRRVRANSTMTGNAGLRKAYNYFRMLKCMRKLSADNNFSSDPEFFDALLVQLKRMEFVCADCLNGVSEEELNEFLLTLDEENSLEFYLTYKTVNEQKERIDTLKKNGKTKNQNAKKKITLRRLIKWGILLVFKILRSIIKAFRKVFSSKKNNPERVIDIENWINPDELVNDGSVKVSVIIPVYNVEKYLEECLDSVINNSFKNIEIICVDDGSNDSSPDILRAYAEKYPRVKIITKENGGLSSARNAGIDEAKGEYILFVDSDDYIEERAIEYLYSEAKHNELDQLFFSAKPFYDDATDLHSNLIQYYNRKTVYNGVMSGRQMFIRMSKFEDFKPSACLQIIRKDFLTENNIRFINGLVYEDNPFTILCLFRAQKVKYANIKLYNRRLRADSIMLSSQGVKSAYDYFRLIKNIINVAQENKFGSDPDFYEALIAQVRRTLFVGAGFARKADKDELKEFLFSLDEKECMEFYYSIKLAADQKLTLRRLRNAAVRKAKKMLS